MQERRKETIIKHITDININDVEFYYSCGNFIEIYRKKRFDNYPYVTARSYRKTFEGFWGTIRPEIIKHLLSMTDNIHINYFDVMSAKEYLDIKGLKAPITEEEYDTFLNMLPPREYFNFGFIFPEPLTGNLYSKFYFNADNKYYVECVERKENSMCIIKKTKAS